MTGIGEPVSLSVESAMQKETEKLKQRGCYRCEGKQSNKAHSRHKENEIAKSVRWIEARWARRCRRGCCCHRDLLLYAAGVLEAQTQREKTLIVVEVDLRAKSSSDTKRVLQNCQVDLDSEDTKR